GRTPLGGRGPSPAGLRSDREDADLRADQGALGEWLALPRTATERRRPRAQHGDPLAAMELRVDVPGEVEERAHRRPTQGLGAPVRPRRRAACARRWSEVPTAR